MLTIANALTENRISKRNVYHIDMHIDLATRQCLKDARWLGLSQVPLIDQLGKNSARSKNKLARHLPLPKGTLMKNGKLTRVPGATEKRVYGVQT